LSSFDLHCLLRRRIVILAHRLIVRAVTLQCSDAESRGHLGVSLVKMDESAAGDRSGSSDESDGEERCMRNAYSIGDLVGELTSDSDIDATYPDRTTLEPKDAACPDPHVETSTSSYVTSEKPAELKQNQTLEDVAVKNTAVVNPSGSVPVSDACSRIYDEVYTEHIYQEPLEDDAHFKTSK